MPRIGLPSTSPGRISGPGVITDTGGGGGATIQPVITPTGDSAFIYNGKTLSLRPPSELVVDPNPPRTVSATPTGIVESVLQPRIAVEVSARWLPFDRDDLLRIQLDNWWQWAVRGNAWQFVFDQMHAVNTTLLGGALAGDNVAIATNPAGIEVGRLYKITSGALYATVLVTDLAGDTLTFSTSVDYNFPAGSSFQDIYLWDSCLLDSYMKCPIRDLRNPQFGFDMEMEFYQAGRAVAVTAAPGIVAPANLSATTSETITITESIANLLSTRRISVSDSTTVNDIFMTDGTRIIQVSDTIVFP